jgi:EAL domain-containing protein (putative c-di-GMP-specific phosphodiesterase class I)
MDTIPRYVDVRDELAAALCTHGGLGAILIDIVGLEGVERAFGESAYERLRAQVEAPVREACDRARPNDLLVAEGADRDRFLLFLTGDRPGNLSAAEHCRLADHIQEVLAPRVARIASAFSREGMTVDVGCAFVLYSPQAGAPRQLRRLIDDARQSAEFRRALLERRQRDNLLEIIYNRRIWTAFQPIVEIQERKVMGHEALSRGPRGSDLQSPLVLFDAAGRHGLAEGLDRSCRFQTFQDWETFGGSGRLFVNTVPATIRDPSFQGRGIIDTLGARLSPQLVTLEITERQIIENQNLYREAMHNFTEMGFTFAIDDLGAGYSGLESLVSLGASYLKIDMGLVRDVHRKRISQQVVKAIADLGTGVGATVIAEGIETEEEADMIVNLGVRYGQGYLFGRPLDGQRTRYTPAVSL